MVLIRVETKKHVIVAATKRAAFQLLRDVEAVAQLMPGVERTETLAGNCYRCVLKPQSSLGFHFQGDYVCAYQDNGRDEISWTSPEGNMRSTGTWKIGGRDGAVTLTLQICTEIELPVPRVLRFAAQKYAELQASRGIDTQLALIREPLEANAARFPRAVDAYLAE
jgi:carbon monoxide dehydrogenase subunit G